MSFALTFNTDTKLLTLTGSGLLKISDEAIPVTLKFTASSAAYRLGATAYIRLTIKAKDVFSGDVLASVEDWTRGATDADLYTGSLSLNGADLITLIADSSTLPCYAEIYFEDPVDGDPTRSQFAPCSIQNSVTREGDPTPTPSISLGNAINPFLAAGTNVTKAHNSTTGVTTFSASGGGGGGAWGSITGTLSNQTDLSAALALKAPLASPSLTGNPTAPTQTAGNNSTRIATTEFVQSAVGAIDGTSSQVPGVFYANDLYEMVAGDPSFDNSVALESVIADAVNYAKAAGHGTAVVEIDPGEYYLTRSLQTTNNAYAQIPLPIVAVEDNGVYLQIRNRQNCGNPNLLYHQSSGGVVLHSLLTAQTYSGTFGWPSIIGGCDEIYGGAGFGDPNTSYATIHLKGIAFRQGPNPSLCCANFAKWDTAVFEDFRCDTSEVLGSNSHYDTEPTHPTGIANRMPANNLDGARYLGRIEVAGYYGGPAISELTEAPYALYSYECKVGLNLQTPFYHVANVNHAIVVRPVYGMASIDPLTGATAPTGIAATGLSPINVNLFDVEIGVDESWRQYSAGIYDPGNALGGRVQYLQVLGFAGNSGISLRVNGGANNLTLTNLATPPATSHGFNDDFDDNALQGSPFQIGVSAGYSASVAVAELGGKLQVNTAASAGLAYSGAITIGNYSLVGKSFTAKVVAVATGAAQIDTILAVSQSGSDVLRIVHEDGSLYAQKIVGGSSTNIAGTPVSYNSTNHRWWRIREATGTIYWEVSPDGATWTALGSVAAPFAVTTLKYELSAGTYASASATGIAQFDNSSLG